MSAPARGAVPVAAVVCAPMTVERLALRGVRAPVWRTGMGAVRSRRSAVAMAGRARLVAGVAGGLAPQVQPGDVVVASEVRGPSGTPVPCPSAPLLAAAIRRLGLTVHVGPVLSHPRVVHGPDRDALAESGALAVDMESWWLAPAAGEPFAVLRVITDTARAGVASPGIVPRGVRALHRLARLAPVIDAWVRALGPRRVLLANPRSFCAGVERAIEVVERALDRFGTPVYVRRQIVHNAHVVADLQARGAVFVTEADEVPAGGVLVLAAHGVAPVVRDQARERDLTVVDATCPLVAKVHSEVRRYAGRGDTVLLIGHAEHEEVQGVVGEAPEQVIVVGDEEAARHVAVADPDRVAYAMQTTLAVDEADRIATALRERFPTLAGPRSDDICYATTNRQRALRAITPDSDLVLVVGSVNSSNSLRLVEVAQRSGAAARLLDDAGDVDLTQLSGVARIGVTAGASAPPGLVDDLVAALGGLGPLLVTQQDAPPEELRFTLPKEVG
jgi:4-hydroxy-3-methylbut-2-en-1-yl diphosphate reductase